MIDSNHLPIFNSLHTCCLATNHISSPSHHHLRYSSTICMRDDEMNGLELPYISLPGVIPKVTCNHRWRRDLLPFFSSLRTQPPTFPPSSSQWVITLKRARQHLLPLTGRFSVLLRPDKLSFTFSMWIQETWGNTACRALFVITCASLQHFCVSGPSPQHRHNITFF